jgi:hypothetical protein
MNEKINTPSYNFSTKQNGEASHGHTTGKGLSIRWHEGGPFNLGASSNGAHVVDVTEAVMQRLRYYQDNELYASQKNQEALFALVKAQELMLQAEAELAARKPTSDGPFQ